MKNLTKVTMLIFALSQTNAMAAIPVFDPANQGINIMQLGQNKAQLSQAYKSYVKLNEQIEQARAIIDTTKDANKKLQAIHDLQESQKQQLQLDGELKTHFDNSNKLTGNYIDGVDNMEKSVKQVRTANLHELKDDYMAKGYDEETAEQRAVDHIKNAPAVLYDDQLARGQAQARDDINNGYIRGEGTLSRDDYFEFVQANKSAAWNAIKRTYAAQSLAKENMKNAAKFKDAATAKNEEITSQLEAIQMTNTMLAMIIDQLNTLTALTAEQFAAESAINALDLDYHKRAEFSKLISQCTRNPHLKVCNEEIKIKRQEAYLEKEKRAAARAAGNRGITQQEYYNEKVNNLKSKIPEGEKRYANRKGTSSRYTLINGKYQSESKKRCPPNFNQCAKYNQAR